MLQNIDNQMFITGFSLKLKTKKVDKILLEKGYTLEECEIYYSPITSWFVLIAMMLSFFIPFVFTDLLSYKYNFWMCILTYFIVGYFFIAYLNNIPVLVKNELIMINPYFPFRNFEVFQIEAIAMVKIDESSFLPAWIFLVFKSNYLENYKKRFYCSSLQVDSFDENWTEKTMDDFKYSLLQNGVMVEFELD